jgi:hypothetical protein
MGTLFPEARNSWHTWHPFFLAGEHDIHNHEVVGVYESLVESGRAILCQIHGKRVFPETLCENPVRVDIILNY